MFHKPVSGLAGIVLLLACAALVRSEDFHVSTRIYDLDKAPQAGKKDQRPPPPQHCESLFHAGKVYDYNQGSEVTIFEPALERFVIMDSAKRTATVVSFVYIDQRLHQARARRAEEQKQAPPALADYLDFELHPRFQVEFDKQQKLLSLDSPFVAYQVKCAAADSRELLEAYLNYADWAARLNYVSYRTSILPDPRLAVNEHLRQRGLLPVKVEMRYKFENGPHKRADHKFIWALDGDNHKAISNFDKMSTARDIKLLSPDEFFEQPIKQARNRR